MYTLVSLVSAGVGLAIAPASVEHYGFRDVAVRDVRDMMAIITIPTFFLLIHYGII